MKLLPCAHCDGAARMTNNLLSWSVECVSCGSQITGRRATSAEAEKATAEFWAVIRQSAADAWNKRVRPAKSRLMDEIDRHIAAMEAQREAGIDRRIRDVGNDPERRRGNDRRTRGTPSKG